jgi:sialic acid synthase SpsE
MNKPYIIAEIGVNHGGDLQLAKTQILLAKEGGADCVKFQTYKANKLASRNSPAYWDTTKEKTKSQFELFSKLDSFEKSDYLELYEYAKSLGIDYSSTPFDLDSIDWLSPLMPFVKIASADILSVPLLRKSAKTGLPVILSTGASTIEEIQFAFDVLQDSGAKEITLLHCVLNYPTDNDKAYLKMILDLKNQFDCKIGYSDHTLPGETMDPCYIAWMLGAEVIEKHFTHDKSLPGNDHYHAMDKEDLLRFNDRVESTLELLGNLSEKQPTPFESPAIENARRSIVYSRNLNKGHVITENDIKFKRPGFGTSTRSWDRVLGMRLVLDVKQDDLMYDDHII